MLFALIDHTGGIVDSWTAVPRLSITIDLSGHFTQAVRAGRIVSEGRSLYFAPTEIHNEAGQLVAFRSSTHKRVHGRDDDAG